MLTRKKNYDSIGTQTSVTQRHCRRVLQLVAMVCVLCSPAAGAGPWGTNPWVEVGRSGLRSDIQVLADAGVIEGPVSAWPLAWGDIAPQLNMAPEMTPYQAAALKRVREAADVATETGFIDLHTRVSIGSNPIQIRSFEEIPRDETEIQAGLAWTGQRFALRLSATYVDDPIDGDEWRADGSYVGVALGNWMLAGSFQDRWWGPGWQSSLILSSNARPIPALTLDRNSTHAFESKWLRWIGPWDFSVMWGALDDDRFIPDSRIFGMRFDFRPFKSLEVGLSRTAIMCGDGRPCDLEAFFNMLIGRDNVGDNISAEDEPGDQRAGFDVRWSGHLASQPLALYTQWIGEDEANFFPTAWLAQYGAETWGQWDRLGTYRFYFEWSDTMCDYRLYRSIRGDGGEVGGECAYNHGTYKTGYRDRGRSIGHSFDNDASVFTLGSSLTGRRANTWYGTIAYGNLNRLENPDSRNTVAQVKTRYREIELMHRRSIIVGEIHLGLGYEYRKNTVTGISDDEVHAFLEWQGTF